MKMLFLLKLISTFNTIPINNHTGFLAETERLILIFIGKCQESSITQSFKRTNYEDLHNLILKLIIGLPWWRSGWEYACQCRGHGFKPWSGKIPHAAEQLGPWAATTEPACLEPVPRNKRGRDSEKPTHHNEEWPPLATTRESPRIETKTQHSQKNKINK